MALCTGMLLSHLTYTTILPIYDTDLRLKDISRTVYAVLTTLLSYCSMDYYYS